jgi:hypothetical protein
VFAEEYVCDFMFDAMVDKAEESPKSHVVDVMLFDPTADPFTVALTTQVVAAPRWGESQLTLMVGFATVTVVDPDPVADGLWAVACTVNVPVAAYEQLCVLGPLVTVTPLPQSQSYPVGAGAPFCGVAVAVSIVARPTSVAVGDAATVTVYVGAGGGGGGGASVTRITADAVRLMPCAVTDTVNVPAVAHTCVSVKDDVVVLAPSPNAQRNGGAVAVLLTPNVAVVPVRTLKGAFNTRNGLGDGDGDGAGGPGDGGNGAIGCSIAIGAFVCSGPTDAVTYGMSVVIDVRLTVAMPFPSVIAEVGASVPAVVSNCTAIPDSPPPITFLTLARISAWPLSAPTPVVKFR